MHKYLLCSCFLFTHSADIVVTLEDTSFLVQEDIGKIGFALQICAIAEEVVIPFVITATPVDASAEGLLLFNSM